MKLRITVGALAVVALAMAGALADDALKSGPQVGSKKITPFHPLNITGSNAGQKSCLV